MRGMSRILTVLFVAPRTLCVRHISRALGMTAPAHDLHAIADAFAVGAAVFCTVGRNTTAGGIRAFLWLRHKHPSVVRMAPKLTPVLSARRNIHAFGPRTARQCSQIFLAKNLPVSGTVTAGGFPYDKKQIPFGLRSVFGKFRGRRARRARAPAPQPHGGTGPHQPGL